MRASMITKRISWYLVGMSVEYGSRWWLLHAIEAGPWPASWCGLMHGRAVTAPHKRARTNCEKQVKDLTIRLHASLPTDSGVLLRDWLTCRILPNYSLRTTLENKILENTNEFKS